MSSFNFWFFLAVCLICYFTFNSIEKLENLHAKTGESILRVETEITAIGKKLEIDKQEKLLDFKVKKNIQVFNGTSCVQCHNDRVLSLPINKISLEEAMLIVRNGNEVTKAKGMPTYLNRPTRDRYSITDPDLKVRLEQLYTTEFLEYSKKIIEGN